MEDSDYNRIKAEMAEIRRDLNGVVAVVDDVKKSLKSWGVSCQ